MLISRNSISTGRGYKVNDSVAFLNLLLEATKKNICKPRETEIQEYTVDKLIRASGELEGDSQVGMILFIGVARDFGISTVEIIDFLGIEKEEYIYKLQKYQGKSLKFNKISTNLQNYQEESEDWNTSRFKNKVLLIKNFLYFYARQHKILFSRPA